MSTDAAAQRLRRRAVVLRALARRLPELDAPELWRHGGDDTWVGPSASHFVDATRRYAVVLRTQAATLHAEARRLERTADELDAIARREAAR